MAREETIAAYAIIALANLGDRTALPAIWRCATEDVRPVIRGTAYWAIGQLGIKEPEQWLERLQQCEELEPEEEARVELQAAIERLKTIVASPGADRKNKSVD